jgi:hypothetical protein
MISNTLAEKRFDNFSKVVEFGFYAYPQDCLSSSIP